MKLCDREIKLVKLHRALMADSLTVIQCPFNTNALIFLIGNRPPISAHCIWQ